MKKLFLLTISLVLLAACAPSSISPQPVTPTLSQVTEQFTGYLTIQDV